MNVKRTFFLSPEEADKARKTTGDRYIVTDAPHYELEDRTILYTCGGASDWALDIHVRPAVKDAANGTGK